MKRWILGLLLIPLFTFLIIGFCFFKAHSDVAFLGDSLTRGWYFPRNNFGKIGDTTEQILARSPAAIYGNRYHKLVLMGGTNDVLKKVDPETTIRNLETMGVEAQKSGEEPILCEIPPIFHSYNPADKQNYSSAVSSLNDRISQLAARHGWRLVDYYHPLLGHQGFSSDGVHMKTRGYLMMEWILLHAAPDV